MLARFEIALMRFVRHFLFVSFRILSRNGENLLAIAKFQSARMHSLLKIHGGVIASRTYAFMVRVWSAIFFKSVF